jgi:transposase-like protein
MEKQDVQGGAPVSGAERSEAEDTGAGRRGRPGRRGVEERTRAVRELLSGKATVDQVAFRFGVRPQVVEKWREIALEGVGQALRQGNAKSAREVELERKLRALERAFTDLAIRHELVERALADRPTRPGKSLK